MIDPGSLRNLPVRAVPRSFLRVIVMTEAVGAQKLTVPYICSGGVTTGAQLAAALALGAW